MKQKDVIIGNEYNIQMEGKPVRVKVIADRGYENGVSRKYRVQRVDNGNVLPKYRTCQALYPLQQCKRRIVARVKAPIGLALVTSAQLYKHCARVQRQANTKICVHVMALSVSA